MNFAYRETLPELIDLGPNHYTAEEYRDCMYKLGWVGRWLGRDRAGLSAFRALPIPPDSILDVGCGGGWFTRKLAESFPNARVTGQDFSEETVTAANEFHTRRPLPNLAFKTSGSLRLSMAKIP